MGTYVIGLIVSSNGSVNSEYCQVVLLIVIDAGVCSRGSVNKGPLR